MKLIWHYLKAFFLVGLIFIGGLYSGHQLIDSAIANQQDPYLALKDLAIALHRIQNDFVEEKNTEELVHAAIEGMVTKLDEHSHYFPPEEHADLEKKQNEWAVGAGMDINREHIITRVATNGPAALAGLSIGDQLVQIDNVSIKNWTVSQIKNGLKGEKGTQFQLQIKHNNEMQNVILILDQVRSINLDILSIQPGYAYVRIDRFADGIAQELQEKLRNLEKIDDESLKGLIIDLRNNPGGSITEGINILDMFLEEGLLTEIHHRHPEQDQRYQATENIQDHLNTKLSVLVNEYSASASELVAGVLQHYERATIVGMPTYGKGSVQKVYTSNNSTLKLTVGVYTLPNGTLISKEQPIIPDIPISLAIPSPQDQLKEKITSSSLPLKEKKEYLQLLRQLSGPQYRPPIIWHKDFTQRKKIDPQLEAAWNIIHSEK